ncbi:hypothetical protein M9H77_34872 [Catharanthus roseus]|uniref:Uncharacterized protein n=1 Tax=Catharanthus roseus TaxID=4058 RepID=A0ACB9ZPK1_CATRO|nr:hypothetical protein M9H77_34872 [Catharanthus roseus]
MRKPHSNQSYSSGYVVVFESVRELHCTWLVSYTRASSDGVDDSNSREWIHLKRNVDRGGCDPISLRGHRIMLCDGVQPPTLVWCLAGIDYKILELDSNDLVFLSGPCLLSPTVALCISLHSSVEAALMCLDSLRLPSYARNPHRIPKSFIRGRSYEFQDKVQLLDHAFRLHFWTVDMLEVNRNYFLTRKLPTFVEYHTVKKGDFCVFMPIFGASIEFDGSDQSKSESNNTIHSDSTDDDSSLDDPTRVYP